MSDISNNEARLLLAAPSGQRPRICAELQDGQCVKVSSICYLEMHEPNIVRIFVSSTTIADLMTKQDNPQ